MCGITGVLYTDGRPASAEVVARMTETIAHRGPDAQGVIATGPVGLGNRRLAIIDLSPDGQQPMTNEDGTLHLVYNGEMYNFQGIRDELTRRGHVFRSRTDTEVILHAYEEWGVDCLHRFNGMFAFALWDEPRQRLWIARDRIGIKPLFYMRHGGAFLFGSEIKTILAHPETPREVDREALSYYLALNYTPAPYTLFEGIRQLEPGHFLLIEADGTTQDIEYWDLHYTQANWGRPQAEIEAEFRDLVEDAVRLRLVSDVPFGAFLSGGVDSSTVSYWMAHNLDSPLNTFSIAFGEQSYNETPYAQRIAEGLGANYHTRTVKPDAAALLPTIVWHGEEPTADSSMVPVYHLAELARQHVTMVQAGDGADEILAGYETYTAHYIHRMYRMVPGFIRRGLIQPLVERLPVSDNKVSFDFKLKRFVRTGDWNSEQAHASWRMIFDPQWRADLLPPDQIQGDIFDLYADVFARTDATHPVDRMLYVDTRFYLPNDMLVKVDRMTMAHSLEARVPFLDHRVVEYVASIHPNLKLRGLRHKKHLLKQSMRGRLPDDILFRKKQGFNVPKGIWIKNDMRDFVEHHLSRQQLQQMGLVQPGPVRTLLDDHFAGRVDYSHQIWCLLVLSVWWQRFFQPGEVPAGPISSQPTTTEERV